MGTRTNGCPGGCGVRSGGFADRRLHPGVGLVSRKLGASCSQRGQLFGTGSANRCHAERTIQAARHGKPFGLRGVDTGGADDSVPGVPGAQERRGVPSESLAAGRFGGVKTLRAFATVAVSNAWRGLVSPPRIMLPSRSKDVHGNPVVTRTKSCGPNPADQILRTAGTAGAWSGPEIGRSSVFACRTGQHFAWLHRCSCRCAGAFVRGILTGAGSRPSAREPQRELRE